MKELIEDFKSIYKQDRKVLVTMFVLVFLGATLFILPILSLTPAVPRVWARYSDINSGYAEGSWWYLASFSVLAILLTVVHCMIAARLYVKRGSGVAMMFLIISISIVLLAIGYLLKILGRA